MSYDILCRLKYIILGGINLADYKKMYSMLFNKITEVIEQLQEIQKQTEDLFINSPDSQLIEMKPESGENDSKSK